MKRLFDIGNMCAWANGNSSARGCYEYVNLYRNICATEMNKKKEFHRKLSNESITLTISFSAACRWDHFDGRRIAWNRNQAKQIHIYANQLELTFDVLIIFRGNRTRGLQLEYRGTFEIRTEQRSQTNDSLHILDVYQNNNREFPVI